MRSNRIRKRSAGHWLRLAGSPAILLLSGGAQAAAGEVPASVFAALPAGHVVRASACSRSFDPPHLLCIVVAVRRAEDAANPPPGAAPPRPVLVYRVTPAGAQLIDRNDHVVLRRDDGGQCDPFEKDEGGIAVSGRSFTIENGVACGQHWTDFVTFRFDPAHRAFIWRSEILESWRLNDSRAPDAEALISDGRTVRRADPKRPIDLGAYRPSR